MAPSLYFFIISIGPVDMNKYAMFDEIPSTTLKDIKETKRYGRRDGRTFGRTDGQRENGIPTHKHSLRGGITKVQPACRFALFDQCIIT